MPLLICTHGTNIDDIFEIKPGTNRIGRAPECGVKIYDKSCSRTHCDIIVKGEAMFIQDLGSRHGTLLNGKNVVRRERLHIGDTIAVGHTELKLAHGDAASFVKPDREADQHISTQQISDRLLAAEVDIVRARKRKPRESGGLFRRLFGGS